LIWVTGQLEEGPVIVREKRSAITELAKDRGLVLLLIATFFAGIANHLSMTFEGIYMRSLGGGNLLIGMMTAFAAYSELPTMFFGQRVARRLGGAKTVILGYGLLSFAYLGFTLTGNPVIVPFFSIFKGLGFGLYFTNTVRILNERAPDEWSATAQSLMTVGMFGIAPLFSGPLGGLIHDTFSPAAVFVLAIGALALAAGIWRLASTRGDLE
jgi:PPP family 3-phenylpropionic acid transporter